jgi:o-succinylbenzoate synthase
LCRPYTLPLHQPWHSAHGQFSERKGFLLELSTDCGRRGYGDAAPLPELGSETLDQSARWLARQLPTLTGVAPAQALALLDPPGNCPSARCALETALLDLLAQQANLPLRRLLNPTASDCLAVNANLGALDGEAQDKLRGTPGFRVYKFKVGVAPVTDELALLQRLAGRLPSGVTLRLDANRAWSRTLAKAFLAGIKGLPVESLEEPLARPTPTSLGALQRAATCALALDESLGTLDLGQVLEYPAVRRLVLKPMLHGGLLRCLDLARRARQAGLEALITTSLDSAAGSWAAAQLAAALDQPLPRLAHGLATSDWLAQDLGRPPPIEGGLLRLPDLPGLGFRPG